MIKALSFFVLLTLSSVTQAFTLSDLDKLIISKKVTAIADLVPLLPEEMQRNVIVVFKSLSLQEASCQNPRVLLFTDDAKLTLTSNGSPNQRGFEKIEIQEFNDQMRAFRYFERGFSNDNDARDTYLSSRSGDLKFLSELKQFRKTQIQNEANPRACLSCHRSDPRPNWDAYSQWPNTLGDDFGNQTDRFNGPFGSFTGLPRNAAAMTSCENLFRDTYKLNARYKHLKIDQIYNAKSFTNNFYTQILFDLNFQRIDRILSQHKEGENIRRVLLHHLWRCELPQQFGQTEFFTTKEGHLIRGDLIAGLLEPKLTAFDFSLDSLYTSLIFGPTSQITTPKFAKEELTRRLVENSPVFKNLFTYDTVYFPFGTKLVSHRAVPKSIPELCAQLSEGID
jgi:hypothetical protein